MAHQVRCRTRGRRVPIVLKGFKDFISRGNVIELAVAVVIGAAFNDVVKSFTDGFLQPLIKLTGGIGVGDQNQGLKVGQQSWPGRRS